MTTMDLAYWMNINFKMCLFQLTKIPPPQMRGQVLEVQTKEKEDAKYRTDDNPDYTTDQTRKSIVEEQHKPKPVVETPAEDTKINK